VAKINAELTWTSRPSFLPKPRNQGASRAPSADLDRIAYAFSRRSAATAQA